MKAKRPCKLPIGMTPAELAKLAQAMDWVIPPDSSPGAGTEAGVQRLVDLLATFPHSVQAQYRANLSSLGKQDLNDSNHPFAQLFIERVKDIYYSYPETGAWADIGFRVKEH